jgi:hypothetical protein
MRCMHLLMYHPASITRHECCAVQAGGADQLKRPSSADKGSKDDIFGEGPTKARRYVSGCRQHYALCRPSRSAKRCCSCTSSSGWMRRGCRCIAPKSSMLGRAKTLRPAHSTASAVSDSTRPRSGLTNGAAILVHACKVGRACTVLTDPSVQMCSAPLVQSKAQQNLRCCTLTCRQQNIAASQLVHSHCCHGARVCRQSGLPLSVVHLS